MSEGIVGGGRVEEDGVDGLVDDVVSRHGGRRRCLGACRRARAKRRRTREGGGRRGRVV